jgi:hypothetical protein
MNGPRQNKQAIHEREEHYSDGRMMAELQGIIHRRIVIGATPLFELKVSKYELTDKQNVSRSEGVTDR